MKASFWRYLTVLCALVTVISIIPSAANAQPNAAPFRDVSPQSWYGDGALYCYTHGYIAGTAEGEFSPKGTLTRAMAVQILYSMNSHNESYPASSFTDVATDKWYHDAAEWAYEKAVTGGSGIGIFQPKTPISRQDLCVMLYKCLAFSHFAEAEADATQIGFTDSDMISAYAADAVAWAASNAIVAGYEDGSFKPKNSVTRAEAAVMIRAFDLKFGHRWQEEIRSVRSCETDGESLFSCTECDISRRVVTRGYHLWSEPTVTAAGCFTEGSRFYSCLTCNKTRTETVPAIGYHAWDAGKITSPAGCYFTGVRSYCCTRCKTTRTETIPAIGSHVWGDWFDVIAADRNTTGYRERYCWHCAIGEGEIYRWEGYYPLLDSITLPSGGYNISTKNIGIKVIYVNSALLGTTSASYTSATANAVRRFQQKYGLPATGTVDLKTWLTMGYGEYDWYNLGTYVTPMTIDRSYTAQDHINTMINVAWDYAYYETEYRIGASGPPGTYADCSGLIYQCLYAVGICPDTNIVDHALAEYEYTSRWLAADPKLGPDVPTNSLLPGDLVFYAVNGKSTVVHVALYAGDGMIYDAWPNIGTTYRSINIPGYYVIKAKRVFP
ncbi:MAG: S-layer homology domain-containing protein [Clostridia bacterium]|nr:S-layer homology domain-containing protein [Clostridia bacterium]